MKFIITIILFIVNDVSFADEYVSRYMRNGYAQPYVQSTRNYTQIDNFSTVRNIYSYTGKSGWKHPYGNRYRYSSSNNYSYPLNNQAIGIDNQLSYQQYQRSSYYQYTSDLAYTQQTYTQGGSGTPYTVVYKEPQVDIDKYINSNFSPPCF